MSEQDVPAPEGYATQNVPEGEDLPEPADLVDDSDLEMIEQSALMAEVDVEPDEEFDVEPDGEDPDEEDDDA